jgi:peptidylprolyl isomerase
MMERDSDPRVRVSACRALSPIPSFDPELFRRALLSDDEHLQVAAVQGIAGARWLLTEKTPAVEGLFAELERVARNSGGGYHWLVQGEAALALARLHRGPVELPAQPELRPYELRVLAAARPEEARVRFEEEVHAGSSPAAVVALEEALTILRSAPGDSSLRKQVRKLAADALKRRDVAITATAAAVLTDSLLLAPDAAPLLLEALAAQTLSDDLEAILAIVEGLGVTRDTRAMPALNEALRSPEPSVARAAAKALKQITGRDFSGQIPEPGSPLHTDFDFRRLWSLPDTVQMTIETTSGPIAIELYTREAPFTVLNFVRLATERRYFDGLTFHRVVPNFVVQGGDPRGDGWGGPGYTIRSEFTQRSYGTGSIGMASAGKDTEGSQFFITHSPQPHLDGRYTLFGRVVTGQQAVDRLQVGDRMTAVRMGW